MAKKRIVKKTGPKLGMMTPGMPPPGMMGGAGKVAGPKKQRGKKMTSRKTGFPKTGMGGGMKMGM